MSKVPRRGQLNINVNKENKEYVKEAVPGPGHYEVAKKLK